MASYLQFHQTNSIKPLKGRLFKIARKYRNPLIKESKIA